MRKFLLFLALTLSAWGVGNAQNFGSNTIINYEGYSLKFTVTNVDPAECEVICSTYPKTDVYITIPDTVVIEGAKFPVKALGNGAFNCYSQSSSYQKKIKSITIPNTVETIGNNAIRCCVGISGIEIPNSVTTIGDLAFDGCSGLLGITIPHSVKTIGGYAFRNCDSFLGVTIPNSIEYMGEYAFSECNKLKVVKFENGSKVSVLSSYVFSGNTVLSDLVIPNSVTTIGSHAFDGCTALTSISIPNSVTTIDDYAFDGCRALSNINIPNSVTTIGSHAFDGCTALTSISIPNSVTTISSYAFNECTALANINIPNSVTTIDDYAFQGCTALASITLPKNITTLNKGIFRGCSNLTNIIIPKNVTYMNCAVFANCKSLKTVVFENNSKLEKIANYNGSYSYHEGAFSGCSSLNSIQLPNSLTYIGERAFYNCTALNHIDIPNSVTNIAGEAFSGSGLVDFEIPNSVITIGTYIFGNCSKLENIIFSNKITSIPQGTFKSCTSMTSIQIPNSITKIGSAAFYECTALENVLIPNSVTKIESDAFRYCSALKNIEIPNSVTVIGSSAFYECTALENVLIPNSVTEIENSAFRYCSSLERVHVAYGVSKIGSYAFEDCVTLRDVTLPASLTSLGTYAFSGCGLIEVMRCLATTPPSNKANIFTALTDVMQIQVPESALATYKNTVPWKNYNIVAFPDLGTTAHMNFDNYVLEFVVTNLEESECKVQCSTLPTTPTIVSIPGSITINGIDFTVSTIADNAFANCVNVTGLVIDNGVKTVGESAFKGCTALNSIDIPESMETLSKMAFANCGNITNISLPSKIKNIGEECFANCNKLASLECRATTVPNTYHNAFNNVPYTLTVQVPQNSVNLYNNAYPWNLYNIIKLIEEGTSSVVSYNTYSLKYTVTSMESAKCEVICSSKPTIPTSVIIPSSVIIGGMEFSVTSIGNGAFANAYNIKEIKCHIEEVPTTASNAFLNLPETINIQVPANSVISYQNASPWNNFNIVSGFHSTITAAANNPYHGSVSGGGVHNDNSMVTLIATPAENCTFINWTENGSVVSNNSQYSFEVSRDRNLVANFISTNYWIADYPSFQNTMNIVSIIQLDGIEHNVGTLEVGAFCGEELRGSARAEYISALDRHIVTLMAGGNNGDKITFKLYDHLSGEVLHLISPEAVTFEANVVLGEVNNPYVLNFISKVNINVLSNPIDKGVINGAGVYTIGDEVTLSASTTSNNYYFINWTENDNVVSESSIYTFIAEKDRNIVANFSESNYWTPNTTQYSSSMTVIGVVKIENVEQRTSDIEIGAFCGNEIRGSQRLIIEQDLDRYYLYLMIYGETNDIISFRLYDHSTATESELSHEENIVFEVNRTLGSIIEPYVFNFMSGVVISASCNPIGAGTISGTGSYSVNDNVTLTAVANEGYKFKNWTLDGNVVSSEAIYSFVAEQTTALVANFNNVHSRNLSEGWNWYSTYVNVSGSAGLNMMKEGLDESAIQIKDQNNFVNYQDGLWYGTLNSVFSNQMYMIQMSEAKNLEMAGELVNPSETPIQLATNWKWIAYPLNTSMNLVTALSNYTPADGDYIKSQNNGFAQYYESLGWRGTLNSLTPGQGYMYKNTSGMVKTLIYPEANAKTEVKANITNENNHWLADETKYPTNMSVIAVVVNEGFEMMNYEIGAFSNGECRGSSRPIYIEELDSHIIFLTIYGESGESINFKYYDIDNEEYYNIENTMIYSANATKGDIKEPHILNFVTTYLDETSANSIGIYPNPANKNSEICFETEYEKIEIYNALGIMISQYENMNRIDGIETSGVYLIKATNKDAVVYTKLIVK